MRGFVLALCGVVLLAGCGSRRDAAPATTTTLAETPVVTTRKPSRPAAPDLPTRHRAAAVQVTVVDGDTNTRIRGARVTIGRRARRSNAKGIARVKLAHRAALVTVAAKPGYTARSVRLSFRTHPKSTIRIYRRSLQWAMYGADPARSQSQAGLRVRPPFRVIWSRGLGTLIEFPAVVQDGVAYIANAKGTVRALDMRNGRVIWRHDTPHGKMAASPAVWGDQVIAHGMDGHIWVLRRSDGKLLWHYTVGSPVESSPVIVRGADVFGAWNGTITALDLRTHEVRWQRGGGGCKITSSAALSGSTLYIGDYCSRLLALNARSGALRWSRS
ncbi:MAG: PQQ-like beta-propeller repeat protein, partial [Actinobacteria bacterium]|nr:PQQ-like beta-propeller repeat protein [Actinomycetota bacterium]